MRSTIPRWAIFGAILAVALAAATLVPFDVGARSFTRVFINGSAVPVSFNDGDSFRIFGGEYRNTQCRLAGFNTLESFGPVHQWGDWHPYELYVLAKRATRNAERGTWHCTTGGERDTYGRLLLDCPDLAVNQIRRGLAHAMTIRDEPSRPEYLRAQQEAIRNRRGIWAHGVPDFVMTSVHSADEDRSRRVHRNRLVSVRDGHSEAMEHRDVYAECQWVCHTELRVRLPPVTAAARRLREDPALAPRLADFFNLHLVEFVSRYHRFQELPEYLEDRETRRLVEGRLSGERARGLLGPDPYEAQGSCALYVDFRRRYGRDRAQCLRGHGQWPPGGAEGSH